MGVKQLLPAIVLSSIELVVAPYEIKNCTRRVPYALDFGRTPRATFLACGLPFISGVGFGLCRMATKTGFDSRNQGGQEFCWFYFADGFLQSWSFNDSVLTIVFVTSPDVRLLLWIT